MDQPYQLLNQNDFNTYTTTWQKLVSSGNSAELSQVFFPNKQFLNYVYFNVADILPLLSSVGTNVIKAKFAVLPVASPSGYVSAFSIILYGVNLGENGKPDTQTSAYFCAAIPAQTGKIDHQNMLLAAAATAEVATQQQPLIANTNGGNVQYEPLAYDLVVDWVQAWQEQQAGSINAAMFTSVFGMLEGYTYPLKDLLMAIGPLLDGSPNQLRFLFGLHQYSKPGNTDATSPDTLLGTVLTVAAPASDIVLNNKLFYYDISEPCPPYC